MHRASARSEPWPASLIRALMCAVIAGLATLAPVRAQQAPWIEIVTTIEYVDDGDDAFAEAAGDWSDEDSADANPDASQHQRFSPTLPALTAPAAIARFGPFAVVDAQTAEMAGDVDTATPAQFAAMLRAYPGLTTLRLVDCPGSVDDAANLALARMIRRAGLATHVPAGGSVRSGAVELFLAGVTRSAAEDAEFGVHSWRDEDGREARDYAASDLVHREYLNYYREMGMDDARARDFYAFTNRAAFDDVHYMTRAELDRFGLLTPAAPAQKERAGVTLAYLLD